jgi:hypothetical protein
MSDYRWQLRQRGTVYPIAPIHIDGGVIRGGRECTKVPPDYYRFFGVSGKTMQRLGLQRGDEWACGECAAVYELTYDPGGE